MTIYRPVKLRNATLNTEHFFLGECGLHLFSCVEREVNALRKGMPHLIHKGISWLTSSLSTIGAFCITPQFFGERIALVLAHTAETGNV